MWYIIHLYTEDMFITSSIDSAQEESLSKKAEVSSPPYKRRRTIRANLDSSTTKVQGFTLISKFLKNIYIYKSRTMTLNQKSQ